MTGRIAGLLGLRALEVMLGTVLSVVLIGGCSSTGSGRASVMEYTAARDLIDQVLNDTFDSVTPKLAWEDDHFYLVPDTAGTGGDKDTGSAKRSRNVMTLVSPAKADLLITMVKDHWTARGYTVLPPARGAPPHVLYATTPQGYRLSLDASKAGVVFCDVTVEDVKVAPHTYYPFMDQETGPRFDAHAQKVDDPYWSH
ncbi:hypothetical protein ACFZB9_04905 [Kitasatospora sp. NPDC008050]|uniref:hypothetical protein n=1 Tax=Kitasatospora sp. NPDC008050 TaxID=3364021 RepID=UPI0036E97668